MSVDEVLAELSPKLRKKIDLASAAPHPEYCETPSIGLNRALNGGFVYGRQVLIWGSKSSAKSSLCLQTVAKAQQQGKVCAWVDGEISYDATWASKLGVDSDKLIYSTARTINDMADTGVALMNAGVDIIVVDSITALLPAIYFEKDSRDLKDLDRTKQIGAESRDMGNALKMLNYTNNTVKPTLLILISQSRNDVNVTYTKQTFTGGNASKFYSSNIIKLFSSESDTYAIKGLLPSGDKLLEKKIGRNVKWDLQFSKTSPGFQDGEYNFYFDGPLIGIDTFAEIVDVAESMGLVRKAGKWYYLGEETFDGKGSLVKKLKEDSETFNDLLTKIN